MYRAHKLAARLRELRAAAMRFSPATMFYVDSRLLPHQGRTLRWALAYLHYRGFVVFATDSLSIARPECAIVEGCLLPLRPAEMTFGIYEMWVAFTINGMALDDALAAARDMHTLDLREVV